MCGVAVKSELAYVYIYYMYICVTLRNTISGAPRGQAYVQDGVPTSYTDTDFALLVRRIRDLDKSITSFSYQGWLTTAPTRLEFVQPLFQQRSDRCRWPVGTMADQAI